MTTRDAHVRSLNFSPARSAADASLRSVCLPAFLLTPPPFSRPFAVPSLRSLQIFSPRPKRRGLNSSATLSSENSFESIAHSFRRSALFRCAEMRAVHSLLVSPLHSKLSLFHSFPLAGLCLPLNALSHIIPRCMRPPLFGLNSSATLSSENSFESIAHSFRRSALFHCAEMRAVHSLLVSPLHSKLSRCAVIFSRGTACEHDKTAP